jgi:predicted outer membrane repeat protein
MDSVRVAVNTASNDGGGIYAYGTLSLEFSIVNGHDGQLTVAVSTSIFPAKRRERGRAGLFHSRRMGQARTCAMQNNKKGHAGKEP